MQSTDPEEFLYFEAKNKNITDSTSIGVGKASLK